MNDVNQLSAAAEPAADALETFVAAVEHLPLFSGTAVQLVRSFDREDITADELGQLISTDAALSMHLLRIVNSPFYGLARRIGTVSDAVAMLGMNMVRRTVTAAVLQRPLLSYLHDSTFARAFWRHELLCAALSRHLASQAGGDPEFAYMAGLLHDVGRLVMLGQFPSQSDVLLGSRDGVDDGGVEVERRLFGFDHAQVGGALLELWGLPEGMVQAAHQHADDEQPDEPGAAWIWRANRVAHDAIASPGGEPGGSGDDLDEPLPWMDEIGLTPKAYRKILDEIAALEGD